MRKDKEKKKNEDNKKLIETAASRLAEIFISQIEFQRNKDKNVYEKRL